MQNVFAGKLWFLVRVANGVPQTRGNTPSHQKNNGNYFLEGRWTRYIHSIIQSYSFIFRICSRFLEGLGGLSTCYHSQNIYIYNYYLFIYLFIYLNIYIYIYKWNIYRIPTENAGLKASQFQVSATVSDVPTHWIAMNSLQLHNQLFSFHKSIIQFPWWNSSFHGYPLVMTNKKLWKITFFMGKSTINGHFQ